MHARSRRAYGQRRRARNRHRPVLSRKLLRRIFHQRRPSDPRDAEGRGGRALETRLPPHGSGHGTVAGGREPGRARDRGSLRGPGELDRSRRHQALPHRKRFRRTRRSARGRRRDRGDGRERSDGRRGVRSLGGAGGERPRTAFGRRLHAVSGYDKTAWLRNSFLMYATVS